MDLLADFLNFGASDFPSKNPFKKCFKIVFFSLWRRDPSGFGATISDAVARSLSKNPFQKCFKIVFFSLWRRGPVLELQFPTPLCVVLLCFATQSLQITL